jgi:hypothetical protein
MRDKNIVITEKQLSLIHQGNIKSFIEQMIRIGSDLHCKGEYLENLKGPFKCEETGDIMLIARIVDDRE